MAITDNDEATETPTTPQPTSTKKKVMRVVWIALVVLIVGAGWFTTSLINAVNQDNTGSRSIFEPADRAPLTGNSGNATIAPAPTKPTLAPPNESNLPAYPAGLTIPTTGTELGTAQNYPARTAVFERVTAILHTAQCNADTTWLKKAIAEGSPEWTFESARITATGPFKCYTGQQGEPGNSIGGVTYFSLGMSQVVYAADKTHCQFKMLFLYANDVVAKPYEIDLVYNGNDWLIESINPSA